MKYLTNSGLSYFLNKIKTYIANQLNSKASVIHTHTKSDITDLPNGYVVDSTLDGTSSNAIANSTVKNALDGKSNTGHTHTKSEITDFPTLASVATSGSYNDLSNKPTTMTPKSHTHGNITNDGKIGSNANKPLITTTGGTVTTGSFGTTANTFCQGNDSRLSDARTPTAHTHVKSEITDFPTLSTVATSGSYNDLSNKPTIPTVNNATLKIQKNGTDVKTFTANASTDVTCNITVPAKVSDLTNDSGYITSSGSCNYANSSGNADTLDGYHHDSFPKTSEALFTVNGLGSPGWSAIGTGTGGSCIQVKTTDNTYPSICFHRGGYSHCVLAESGGQLGTMQQGSETFNPLITSANIGSQNVNYANSAGSCNYANSAGNSDTLDGYHEYSFLRNRGATSASGEGTLWAQIGIKEYYNALPDGLNDVYGYGETVSLAGTSCRFDIYCSHHSSNGGGLYYRSGWDDDKKDWRCFIDSANIGSQSVNYANSAGYTNWLRTSSHADHLFHTEWDGGYFWTYVTAGDGGYRAVRVERSNSSGWADSAGSVAWTNVSGRPTALSQFTNDSGFLTSHQSLSGYVPRSGGAVMTGNTLSRTINNDELRLDGGTGWSQGASVVLTGKDNGNYTGYVRIVPQNGSVGHTMALIPDGGWVWDGAACQITSDQRLKQQISNIDNKLLDAWENVLPCQFKYNDAVEQKGDTARLHTGYVVQQIDSACKEHGVDVSAYGLFCHEEYPEETEEVEVEQEDGTTTKETKVIREASEHYSLRYTEVYAVECMYLRRENSRLKEKLASLEERLERLENQEK